MLKVMFPLDSVAKQELINNLKTKASDLGIDEIPVSKCKKFYYVNTSNQTLCYDIDDRPIVVQDILQKNVKISASIQTYDYPSKKNPSYRHIGVTIKAKKICEVSDI